MGAITERARLKVLRRIGRLEMDVAVIKSDAAELKTHTVDLKAGVDQLRHIFGLNGDTSPEAAEEVWRRTELLAAANRKQQTRKEAIATLRELALKETPIGLLVKVIWYITPFALGALAFKVVGGVHIHTAWGTF